MEENKVARSLGVGFKLFNTWLQGFGFGVIVGFVIGAGMVFGWRNL